MMTIGSQTISALRRMKWEEMGKNNRTTWLGATHASYIVLCLPILMLFIDSAHSDPKPIAEPDSAPLSRMPKNSEQGCGAAATAENTVGLRVGKNDSLYTLLSQSRLNIQNQDAVINAFDSIVDPRKLHPGDQVYLTIRRTNTGSAISSIRVETVAGQKATMNVGNAHISADTQQQASEIAGSGRLRHQAYSYNAKQRQAALIQNIGRSAVFLNLGRPIASMRVTSPFGWRIHPVFGDLRFHKGVDFGAPLGTPVFAAANGVVADAGWRGNYGEYIRLKHADNVATAYAHLNGFAPNVVVGSQIQKGEVIGYVGESGVATGPHLYYEVLLSGKQVDPLALPKFVPVRSTNILSATGY